MLELHRVARLYGHKVVFKDVSCTCAAGSITLLAGNNGAGKSTLLRIMAGFSRPSSGTAHFTMPTPRVGYLAHATFVYPALTALENLTFWREAYGLDIAPADLLAGLERVDLAAHAHERAGVFSRGMAQRLNLARVLMLEPDILLLDEPGAGLDAASRALLHQEILSARKRGACVTLVSHDLVNDAPLADRVLLLKAGKLAFNGPITHFRELAGGTEQTCCA